MPIGMMPDKAEFNVRIATRKSLRWIMPALGMSTLAAFGGCSAVTVGLFVVATYTGDLSCALIAENGAGMQSQDEFTAVATLQVRADGVFVLDGTVLELGARVNREIATAEMSFEITELDIEADVVRFTAEPRPTLPGITATGLLTETYRWRAGTIEASRELDIDVTDVSDTLTLTGSCDGELTAL